MTLQRLVGPGETNAVSFEFFPPATDEALRPLQVDQGWLQSPAG